MSPPQIGVRLNNPMGNLRYPAIRLSPAWKGPIRGVEILSIALSPFLPLRLAILVSFTLLLLAEITEYGILRKFARSFEGMIRPTGELRGTVGRPLGGGINPSGSLAIKPVPSFIDCRGFKAKTHAGPGSDVYATVINSTRPINFTIAFGQEFKQQFEDAVEFAYELYGNSLKQTNDANS